MVPEILEYEKNDYLLINSVGQVVAVSGNEDFGQSPPDGPYVVIKVVDIRKDMGEAGR